MEKPKRQFNFAPVLVIVEIAKKKGRKGEERRSGRFELSGLLIFFFFRGLRLLALWQRPLSKSGWSVMGSGRGIGLPSQTIPSPRPQPPEDPTACPPRRNLGFLMLTPPPTVRARLTGIRSRAKREGTGTRLKAVPAAAAAGVGGSAGAASPLRGRPGPGRPAEPDPGAATGFAPQRAAASGAAPAGGVRRRSWVEPRAA